VRKTRRLDYLRPDGKSQVTVRYEGDTPVGIEKVLISAQHREGAEGQIKDDLIETVIRPVMPDEFFDEGSAEILVNPTGRFVTGGPQGDTGLTGRKIIVDTYGGSAPHGGGAFSGKDATKVDRSASYAARWVAKNLVAAGIAGRCLVQVAYAIGVARPVSVMVETFGTAKVDPATLGNLVMEHFDLRPGAIIRDLELRKPIFAQTAAYGHFGRRPPPLRRPVVGPRRRAPGGPARPRPRGRQGLPPDSHARPAAAELQGPRPPAAKGRARLPGRRPALGPLPPRGGAWRRDRARPRPRGPRLRG
jgi:S-adenosylmethionine synthetase